MSARLSEVVAASQAVAATRSRKRKTDALADVLRSMTAPEAAIAVGFLTGEVRQGRIGVGWATLGEIDADAADEPSLSVHDVDRAVTELAATTGAGSQAARRQQLDALFSDATADEQDFLRRLLIGDLRQGALEGLMADALAKAIDAPAKVVRRALMLSGDLALTTAIAFEEGAAGLEAVGLSVLRPVQPMLAATSESVTDALSDIGAASIEWKLDGARIQLHRDGQTVRVFTRNLNDITDRLPEIVQTALGFDGDTFVLDGEVMAFADDQSPVAFQDTMSRFGTEEAPPGARTLRGTYFDILHLDGRDLIDLPLTDRQQHLAELVGDARIPTLVTTEPADAEAFAARALDAGHEGVMVKSVESRYEAGRRGKTWRKVKPVHTLDLVVLAVEWGSGRRQGWLSNLHLGARDSEGSFVMVGKTFKGMTDELLAWQTETFLGLETHRDGHVVFVEPTQVVEIAIDGVQASTRYPGGVALRFARVKHYRPDKRASDADTIDAVRAHLHGS